MALINIRETSSVNIPVATLTHLSIPTAVLHGSIYWVPKNTIMNITADIALPDGDLMVMSESLSDATNPKDADRFVATISGGKMTMTVFFEKAGNYRFNAARINRGLDRIGAGVHLSFDDIEFDVYAKV